jgi:hypothetical protein
MENGSERQQTLVGMSSTEDSLIDSLSGEALNGPVPLCRTGEHDYRMYDAVQKGDLDAVKKQLRHWTDKDFCLYTACLYNHETLVQFFLDNGAHKLNYGLQGACAGKHKKLMYSMLLKGANGSKCLNCFSTHTLSDFSNFIHNPILVPKQDENDGKNDGHEKQEN